MKLHLIVIAIILASINNLNAQNLSFSTPGSVSSYRPGSNARYVVAVNNSIASSVSKVEFYKDNVKIAEDLTAPYEHTISNVQAGYYKVHAAAFNSSGNTLATTNPSELFVGNSKVGVRPLPRGDNYDFDKIPFPNNPGGYFADYSGQYPFVASHTDVLTHVDFGASFAGDFRTKKSFFEHYLPFDTQWIDTNPQTNPLIENIAQVERFGVELEHIIIAREGELYGKPTFTYGPFAEDSRILYQRDVDEYRKLFQDAYDAGIIKHNNYKLIQLVASPTAFYTIPAAREIIKSMDGVCFESHQYNVHWPLETGIEKNLQETTQAIRWTLANNLDFVFYYGPWRSTADPIYYTDAPKDWLLKYWAAGLPKHHDKMYFYTNNFPHDKGGKTPIGPETNTNSHTGFVKWLIEQVGNQTAIVAEERIPNMQWNFDKSIERWGALKDNCNSSWVNNSLVVTPIASGSVGIGVTGVALHMNKAKNFAVRLKNESHANQIVVNFWVAKPGIQAEEIKSFTLPITPNSLDYKIYQVDLANAIAGYSSSWRVNNIRIDIPNQTNTSKVSFDYVNFFFNFPLTQTISIEGESIIEGMGVKKQYSVTTVPELASKKVLWSVDNTNIATIDENTGLLTTVTPGKIVLSASSTDGSGAINTKTVTVTYNPIISIPITLSPITNHLTTTLNAQNEWEIAIGAGGDPYVYTELLTTSYTEDVRYLSFDYQYAQGGYFEFFYYRPSDGSEPVNIDPTYYMPGNYLIPTTSTGWRTKVIDLSKETGWFDAQAFRFDFGMTENANLKMKNIKLSNYQDVAKTQLFNYTFEDNLNDISGKANHALFGGTGSMGYNENGRIGKAASMNNQINYFQSPANIFTIDNDYTLDFWVKVNNTGLTQYPTIVQQLGTNGRTILGIDRDANKLYAFFGSNLNFSSTPIYNNWMHIVMVFQQTRKKLIVFVNDMLDSEFYGVTYTNNVSNGELRFGQHKNTAANRDYVGLMDEVKLYNTSLSLFGVNTSSEDPAKGIVSASVAALEGSEVTVTATPLSGNSFVNWTENGVEVSTSASYTFTALTDRTLVAIFSIGTSANAIDIIKSDITVIFNADNSTLPK